MPRLTQATACYDHEVLAATVRAEFTTYAAAVAVLERSIGKENFGKVSQWVERARIAYEAAAGKLAEHLASHGCGSSREE